MSAGQFAHQRGPPKDSGPLGIVVSHRAVEVAVANPAASITAPQKVLPGSALQPGTTLPRIGGQSQG